MDRVRDRVSERIPSGWRSRVRRAATWAKRSYLVMIVVGVVVGLQAAPVVTDLATEPVAGTVAVVPLEGGINGGNAASTVARLKRAQSDPSVDAVVLRVNSPGGGAASSETIYLQVAKTAEEKPVVASVDSMAASGGYYAAAPSDEIVVKPSTLVGSVGVFFMAPQEIVPLDGLITSGPNKLSGGDRREWYYKTAAIHRAFSNAVIEGRGDRLELSREELAYAKLYTGGEAVQNGLADRIGGLDTAVKRAADRAGLATYRVKYYGYDGRVTFLTRSNYLASDAADKELVSPAAFVGSPSTAAAPSVVMLPPSVVRRGIQAAEAGNASREVIENASAAP